MAESNLLFASLTHLKERYEALRTELRERRNAAVQGSEEYKAFDRLYTDAEGLRSIGVRYEEVRKDYLNERYGDASDGVTELNVKLDTYEGLFAQAKALYKEEPTPVTTTPPPSQAAPAPTPVREQPTRTRRRRSDNQRRDAREVTERLQDTSN